MRNLTVRELRQMILQEGDRRPRPQRLRRRKSLVDLLFEQAEPGKLESDKFPMPLSSVNQELADKLVKTGLHDGDLEDDIIAVGPGKYAAADLFPSQTSMDVNKAWWFALGMLNNTMFGSGGPGGDIGAFVSSDNYIMDGHHRWIATAMVKPGAPIKGIKVEFPGAQLVPVLNAATVGLLGITKGKAGSGGFDQFQKRDAMLAALQGIIDGTSKFKGVAGEKKTEAAVKVIEKWTGKSGPEAVEAAVDLAMANLGKVPGAAGGSAVMPGAPDRIDMPVIDDDEAKKGKPAVATVKAALEKGEIDVNPEYGELPAEGEGEGAEGEGEEKKLAAGVNRKDDLIMERWRSLAGIL